MTDMEWARPLDALFISPHADDVEVFCGATVAKLAATGYRVGIADLTAGELATNGTPEDRRRESLNAAAALGVTLPRPVLTLPDGGVDEHDPAQVCAVVEVLRAARPRLLFGPFPRDRHPDHEAAGRLLRRAVFLAGLSHFDAAGEAHRPRALVFYPCHAPVEPDFLVDVSQFMPARDAALACYVSQLSSGGDRAGTYINAPTFAARGVARRVEWGGRVGVEAAEGFVVESAPLIGDPVDFFDPQERP